MKDFKNIYMYKYKLNNKAILNIVLVLPAFPLLKDDV